MIFYDAEIYIGIKPSRFLGKNGISLKGKAELLLIYCGRSEHNSLLTFFKPFGRDTVGNETLIFGFILMGDALSFSVADADNAGELLSFTDKPFAFNAAMRARYPAGIKSEPLCEEHEPFAVIAAFSLSPSSLFPTIAK